MTDLFVLPFSINNNPYLQLLYAAVESSGMYTTQSFSFAKIYRSLLLRRHTVVHIHWESNVYGSRFVTRSLLRMGYRFPLLFGARLLGAKIVWTMHNLSSHDYPHPSIDKLGKWLMWRLAQGVIIQNRTVAEQMTVGHPKVLVAYIPHPAYKIYGPQRPQARDTVRGKFGVKREEILLMSIGMIRSYKRLEILIDAVRDAQRVKLVIAGKCEQAYADVLRSRAIGAPVVLESRFVPDADIPAYLAAADYCVFAYDDSAMTSGAVMLALAYGVPVILCDMQLCAQELVRKGVGFSVNDTAELTKLIHALPSRPSISPSLVEASVADLTWERAAKEMCTLYEAL